MSVVEFLSSVKGFRGIERSDLETIAPGIETRTYGPEAYLMREGEPGDEMHIIREGQVRVPIFDPDGREKMLFHLGPGELVGEMALLTGEPRSADVIAETDVTTLVLKRGTLEPLLGEYPQLARFLTEILGRRLEEKGGLEQVGKYRLLGKLGEGTSGKVYEALHPGLNRVVAVKMLSHSLVYNPKFCERFMEEARTVASLAHPNIVQVFDTEKAYATYFIVMEKLSGSNLAALLAKRKVLEAGEAARILRQMGAALAYAHQRGFAHRDVKPANVALAEDGVVKIMDFGLARPISGVDPEQKVSSVDGTPQYIAPETAMGRVADGRVDIYALGVIAFEMVTGRLPFDSADVMQMLKAHVREEPPDIDALRPDLPGRLRRFIKGALIKKPEERLSDWPRILRLLDLDDSGGGVWSDAAEQVLHLRYRPGAAPQVNEAIERLLADLRTVADVELARGRLDRAHASGGNQSEGEAE